MAGDDGEQACDVGHEADLLGDATDFVHDLWGSSSDAGTSIHATSDAGGVDMAHSSYVRSGCLAP